MPTLFCPKDKHHSLYGIWTKQIPETHFKLGLEIFLSPFSSESINELASATRMFDKSARYVLTAAHCLFDDDFMETKLDVSKIKVS